jgi:hypothetical protein
VNFFAEDDNSDAPKSHILSVFSASRKNLRAGSLDRAARRIQAHHARSSRRNIWCRRARKYASSSENAGFFVAL